MLLSLLAVLLCFDDDPLDERTTLLSASPLPAPCFLYIISDILLRRRGEKTNNNSATNRIIIKSVGRLLLHDDY